MGVNVQSVSGFKGGTLTAPVLLDDTTNVTTAPPLAFDGDSDTGIGHSATDTLDLVIGGASKAQLTVTGYSVGGIAPAAAFHGYGPSGTVSMRLQSGSSIVDMAMTATTFFFTNYAGGNAFNAAPAGAFNAFYAEGAEIFRADIAGLKSGYPLGRGAPVTKTADFTLAATETHIINNKASGCVGTLSGGWAGRELFVNNEQAQTLTSASSNVVPKAGGAAGTAILPATDGAWAFLVHNGTNWKIMMSGT
jgi:hypothetical protein